MKDDSSWNHHDQLVNQELQPTSLNVVGKDQHFLLDDASHATGCVVTSLNRGFAILEATWKEVPVAVSRLSQDVTTAASQIGCAADIQDFMVIKDLPVLLQQHRETYQADDLVIARNNSMLSASTGDDLEHVEEATVLTFKTEDEVKQVVDFVVDHLVNFLGLQNECKSTAWSACHASLPIDDEQVSSLPITQKREYRQLRSTSRSNNRDQSRRETPEELLTGETTPQTVGQDEDLISETAIEYDLETFSRHSLMEDKSKSTEPDQIRIGQRGQEMIIDRRTVEAIMDFLAYPEKYLELNQPKTYTRKLLASLKRRREEMANQTIPDPVSKETTTGATSANVSDVLANSNERSLSKSDRSNFEKVMDIIAFPEKHCIPKLKASLQGKNMEHRSGQTGINQAGPQESPCEISTTYEERIFADFLHQHCNIDKNALPKKLTACAAQGETTSSGKDFDGGQSLNHLRRDRSLLSQCSTGTDDSSHSSVRSNKSGRFFGSDRAINSDRVSRKAQRNKNAVERYIAMATKK